MGRFLGNTFDTATARTDPGRATLTRSDTVIADNLRHSATRRHASRSPTLATRDTTSTTHQEAHKSTYLLLATNAHNGSQGCTANPDKTTGATRVTHMHIRLQYADGLGKWSAAMKSSRRSRKASPLVPVPATDLPGGDEGPAADDQKSSPSVDGGGRTTGVDTGGLDGARVGDKRERPNAADLENTNTEASVHEAQVQDELSGGASALCAAQ